MTTTHAQSVAVGKGPTVLCLHSSLVSSAQWLALMNRLKENYRVIVVDLYGYGASPDWNGSRPLRLEDEVDLVMGTFSKSLATVGGFIAGPHNVVDYVRHHARSQIFSAAPPPGAAAASFSVFL